MAINSSNIELSSHATLSLYTRNEGTFTYTTRNRFNANGVIQRTRQFTRAHKSTGQQSGWHCWHCGKGKGELVRHAGEGSSRSSNFSLIFFLLKLPQYFFLCWHSNFLPSLIQCLLLTVFDYFLIVLLRAFLNFFFRYF